MTGQGAYKPDWTKQLLRWTVDYFIPPSLLADQRLFLRAQMLVSLAHGYTLLTSSCLLWIWLWSPFAERYRLVATLLLLPLCLFFSLLPWLLRWFRHYPIIANMAVLVSLVFITMGVAMGGGPMESAVNYLMVFPAFMAIILLGFNYGVFWSVLVLLVNVSMAYLHFNGYMFPRLFDYRYYYHIDFVSWLVSFVAATGPVLIYQRMTTLLYREVDARQQEYRFLATHDVLTRIPNRTLFEDRLEQAIRQNQRNHRQFALMYLDLDGFKPVNDTYGHACGDKTLIEVASRLARLVRRVDTVARLGGDEFAIILVDVEKQSDIDRVAEKALKALAEPIPLGSVTISLSASIGIAIHPQHGVTPAELKRRADVAMYWAKRRKNMYCVYDKNVESQSSLVG